MKNKLPILTFAIALILAGCSSIHTLTENNTKKDEITAARNKEVQRDFIYNLILLARCNPQLLDDYAYLYDFYPNGFSSLYFTGFSNLYFTPYKLYLSYNSSYRVRGYAINEYVSQYANPYTPAPAGFQKNNIQINSSKYVQPVQVTRGYHYVNGSNIDYATTGKSNNFDNKNVVRNYDNTTSRNSVNSQASKFENVTQPQKTYSPAYADNNDYQNSNQSFNKTSNNSQDNNTGNTKNTQGNMPPR